jgi:hypothetical protein
LVSMTGGALSGGIPSKAARPTPFADAGWTIMGRLGPAIS